MKVVVSLNRGVPVDVLRWPRKNAHDIPPEPQTIKARRVTGELIERMPDGGVRIQVETVTRSWSDGRYDEVEPSASCVLRVPFSNMDALVEYE